MSASAAAAAGYTLAAGPVRAEAIKTDTSGLDAGTTRIEVSGGEMPAYFARPAKASKPPIVLVAMEIFGLHEYIKDVARRLAKLGALAVAPDYYFRQGNLAAISEISKLMPLVNSKPDAELISDLDATVRWAESQGGDKNRIGIIGFCRGGRTVWEYCATSDDVKAGVSFYGSLIDPAAQKPIWPKSPIELASQMKAPVLGLYGAEDQGITLAQVARMKAALAAAEKTAEFKIYPGAGHGFHADYRPSYNKSAAEDAWQEATAWLKKWNVLS
jgi:carboxymethylenebutenolidase